MVKYKLVSYELCPFVQQVSIVLSMKNIEYDIEFIDLSNPPEWFTEVSPLKKVPILLVGADQVLFESIAIIEFIEDSAEQKTYPSNLVERCRDRAWIQFINQMMWSLYDLSVNSSESEYGSTVEALHKKLDQLEAASGGGQYLFGESFSLVEATLAPLLLRIGYIDEIAPGILDEARHRNICRIYQSIISNADVQRSTPASLQQSYYALLAKRQGYLAAFLGPGFSPAPQLASRY